ncbi:MAG TPA: Lrp/AsnC family transcriptional regulator [Armatimonadota bacterium]|nr:Lrp/AsnC family transcriptional regulator [Armatimonadota bacterium]
MEEILRILEEDCRLSAEEIASMTGKSPDEVKATIEEYERKGIIRRYKTVIDWEKLGEEPVIAFIDVRVSPERGVGFDDVAERIYRFPEVRAVYLVSGPHDLRVQVSGKSMKEVAFFVAEKLATIDRVQSTNTHFLLKRYKEDGVIFEAPEGDRRLAITP